MQGQDDAARFATTAEARINQERRSVIRTALTLFEGAQPETRWMRRELALMSLRDSLIAQARYAGVGV